MDGEPKFLESYRHLSLCITSFWDSNFVVMAYFELVTLMQNVIMALADIANWSSSQRIKLATDSSPEHDFGGLLVTLL